MGFKLVWARKCGCIGLHFISNGAVNDVSLIKNIVELLEETKRILEGVSCYRWGSQTRLKLRRN